MNYRNEGYKKELRITKIIFRCIARNRNEEISNLYLDKSLNNDLGLDGDDVYDLFEDINRYVKIDWSNFNFSEYFRGEGGFSSALIISILSIPVFLFLHTLKWFLALFSFNLEFNKLIKFKNSKRDFQIKHLVVAGLKGKWVTNEITSPLIETDINDWKIKFQNRFNKRYLRKS